MRSEQLNEFATALSNLQGDLGTVNKNARGYGYKYATLDECMNLLKPLLKKYGFCLSQPLKMVDGKFFLETILIHKSGQYLSSICPLEINEKDLKMSSMQKIGSAITYARRYSLGIIGITTDEDVDDLPNVPVKKENVDEQKTMKLNFMKSLMTIVNNDEHKLADLLNSIEFDSNKNYTREDLTNLYLRAKHNINS